MFGATSLERSKVKARITRMELGNFGDSASVGGGVHELRIDYGPGYRAYWAWLSGRVVILIVGGDKSTQAGDIKRAKAAARDLQHPHADAKPARARGRKSK